MNRELTPNERLIVALDLPTRESALSLVEQLGDSVSFYKVGWGLFLAEGPRFIQELRERCRVDVFLDLKLPDDIPEQIRCVIESATRLGVRFITLSAMGATIAAAKQAKEDSELKLLSVTALTSVSTQDLKEHGVIGRGTPYHTFDEYILWRARYCVDHGSDGLVSSGKYVVKLREAVGKGPLIVCPGIRPDGSHADDHKQAATPEEAIRNGADFLVVGRPIRTSPSPRSSAEKIVDEIDRALSRPPA